MPETKWNKQLVLFCFLFGRLRLQQTICFALGVRSGLSTPTRDDSVDTFTMDLGEEAGLDDFVPYLAGANLLSPLQASMIAHAASHYTIKKRS